MLVLALDSCGPACNVGLWQDGRIVAQAREVMERGQDARLVPMIMDVLAQADCGFPDLDLIAATRGPGSFTGVRVGLATARGLGLAAGKPVLGIDRFAIYHLRYATTDKNLLVVINSKRTELFCKFFPAKDAAHEAQMMTEEEISAFIAQHPDTAIAGDLATPDDEIIATCAQLAAQADSQDPAFLPRPLYLRAPDVTMPNKGAVNA